MGHGEEAVPKTAAGSRRSADGVSIELKPESATRVRPLSLRLRNGDVIPVKWPDIERDAVLHAYRARNRRRWLEGGQSADEFIKTDYLGGEETLKQIAEDGIVEVEVPWSQPNGNARSWAPRVMPWEFIISAATSPYRLGRPLSVIRRLAIDSPHGSTAPLGKSLFVECAPGALTSVCNLSVETRMMRVSLGLEEPLPPEREGQLRVLRQPSLKAIGSWIDDYVPGLVHFAGYDTHQAADILGESPSPSQSATAEALQDPTMSDGLAISNDSELFVSASNVAAVLARERPTPPSLISLNVYNSAASIAPHLVAAGIPHVLSFQDTIDDRISEHFFVLFYRALAQAPHDVLGAFQAALGVLLDSPQHLSGACIVLWSSDSLLQASTPATPRAQESLLELSSSETSRASERVTVFCDPVGEMNYSLLHNGRSPFDRFQIVRGRVSGPICDIGVSVTMYVGQDSFPFVKTLTMSERESVADITDDIVVPLTSTLMRMQSEKIRSVLAVEVKIGADVVHRETYRLTIAPVDQWSDTDANRLWLPSFVLPRDPKVAAIVQSARNYLVLRGDDPSAGFAGYQSGDRTAVDSQVCAIWYALLLDRPLLYINPPPSYPDPKSADFPQRLRTPTEITTAGHGTCIDLALLLCACLEYVDIYPTMFLLDGHAFAGYWALDRFHDEFEQFRNLDPADGAQLRNGTTTDRLEASYTLPKSAYGEIMSTINRGELVPVETTLLTLRKSFMDATRSAKTRLGTPGAFQSLLDIHRAREEGIAPLPILWRPH